KALLTGKTTHAAWRSKPSWYAVSTEDRTINPDLQRFMAKRMGAKTIEGKASHGWLISQPETMAELIVEAAEVGEGSRRSRCMTRTSPRSWWSIRTTTSFPKAGNYGIS